VQFYCDLDGTEVDADGVKALLRAGKNFDHAYNMPITPLSLGC